MSQVTQEKYNLVKQLFDTPLNNLEIGKIVELDGSTVGRIKKSKGLEDYKKIQRMHRESYYPYLLDKETHTVATQVVSKPESALTVTGELTRIANVLDRIVEVLER